MKKQTLARILCLAAAFGWAGCQKDSSPTPPPVGKPSTPAAAVSAPANQVGSGTGKVLETMNSGGYTYVKVEASNQTLWAAAPQFTVKVGDEVTVPPGMPMQNFHSSTLKRDFELIYFVDRVTVGNVPSAPAQTAALPAGHPPIDGGIKPAAGKVEGITKAEGGRTIAEIFASKAELQGEQVKVRGKVVKFNANIMGKNWLHIQDGTGGQGTDDLTVTTAGQAKVGDVVLVTGKVATDKDFGYNYKYAVLVEEASLVVE